MGVRKHYDKFVSNFLTGNRELPDEFVGIQKRDSDDTSSTELEASKTNSNVKETDMMDTSKRIIDSTKDAINPVSNPSITENIGEEGSSPEDTAHLELRDRVISALKEVYDPEIPVNIYDLGLIYRIDIDADNRTAIDMTLTSPNCPVAGSLPQEVENAARSAEGVGDVIVEVVWDPPWDMDRMGEAAKLELGLL